MNVCVKYCGNYIIPYFYKFSIIISYFFNTLVSSSRSPMLHFKARHKDSNVLMLAPSIFLVPCSYALMFLIGTPDLLARSLWLSLFDNLNSCKFVILNPLFLFSLLYHICVILANKKASIFLYLLSCVSTTILKRRDKHRIQYYDYSIIRHFSKKIHKKVLTI